MVYMAESVQTEHAAGRQGGGAMRRRATAIGLVALLLTATAPNGASSPQQKALTLTGWVRMATADDQRTTVMTMTVGGTPSPETDIVTRAFRVQHPTPMSVEYEGPATVVYAGTHLVVQGPEDVGWVFVVAGRVPGRDVEALPYPRVEVSGLSHFWGTSVHGTEPAVLARLLPTGCATTDGDPNCAACAQGGPGATACSAECGSTGCDVTCGTGTHACCNCPARCGCCPDIIGDGSEGAPARSRPGTW
jgi:hypothetical protein